MKRDKVKQAKKKIKNPVAAGAKKKKKTGQKVQIQNELRVLILEDNPADAELIERQLRKAGNDFISRRTETRNGFLQALKSFKPDIILADFMLPKFNALQALELRGEKAPFTPFIIVTGSISEETAVECMKQGADDYLLKDRLARLGEAVRNSLANHRLQTEKMAAEKSLRANERLYRTFIDSSSDMAFLKDDRFRHLLANRALCRFYRKAENEIIGKTDSQLMDKSAAAKCHRSDKQALTENRVNVSEETFGQQVFETRKFPVKLGDNRIGVGGYIRDISECKQAQELLRTTSRRLELALHSAKAGSWDWDVANGGIEWSPQMFELFGLDPRTAAASFASWRTALHPEDREPAEQRIELALKQQSNLDSDYRVILPGGQVRWINAVGEGVYDAQGLPIQMLGICLDITERKQAENALIESEDRYRDLIENSQDLICTHNLEGKLLSVNRAATRLTGYAQKDLLSMNMADLLVPRVRHFFKAYLAEIKAKGRAHGLMWIRTASGETRYWEYNNTLRTKDVAVPLIRGLARDITERKRAEAEILREKTFLEVLVETAPEGIAITDSPGRVLQVNGEFVRMFGYEVDEIIGKMIDDLVVPPGYREEASTFTKPSDAGKKVVLETVRKRKDGTFVDVSIIGAPIYIAGRQVGVYAIYRDITERKRAEEQVHASLLEKEVLLKEIHHRVKNNLQVISGLLSLQAAQTNDEQLQRMVKESQGRIWTMALIHQTLYQSGNLADIDMADYIRTLSGNLLSSHAQVAMPPTVSFDLVRLRLVIDKAIPLALIINELMTNAMKHAFPDGRPGEIRISLHESRGATRVSLIGDRAPLKNTDPTPKEGTACPAPTHELIVTDNGSGLPAGFDLKNQKSLGMQLVAMLTKQLGGQLAIESSSGTSVRIQFS